MASKRPRIGEDIFAIGSPKGLSNSLTKGTISGFRENDRIQIDAVIDHGSSGGPLFNIKGEVIGITTSGMGTGSELNFAINIQVLAYEKYIR
ncbi:trypsin-like peptidase domain-containing protein [Salegentibacter flavus]|uniref:trypsin-like peptidase domain-containing protein n=1 Tax=Salegentibacter flavus TaxID=287099 RepID=UPI00373FD428